MRFKTNFFYHFLKSICLIAQIICIFSSLLAEANLQCATVFSSQPLPASFFQIPPAEAEFLRSKQILAEDPLFLDWLKASSHPGKDLALKVAKRITFEELKELARAKIAYFPMQRGCGHCCLGCVARAPMGKVVRQNSMEATIKRISAINALVEFLTFLKDKKGQNLEHTEIFPSSIAPYFDSDPFISSFSSPSQTLYQYIKMLQTHTERYLSISTTGWSPRDQQTNEQAKLLIQDWDNGRIMIDYNIKLATARALKEIDHFLIRILENSPYLEDLKKHGLKFQFYGNDQNRLSVLSEIQELIRQHILEYVETSSFIQDRLDNLFFLKPLFDKKIGLFDVRRAYIMLYDYFPREKFKNLGSLEIHSTLLKWNKDPQHSLTGLPLHQNLFFLVLDPKFFLDSLRKKATWLPEPHSRTYRSSTKWIFHEPYVKDPDFNLSQTRGGRLPEWDDFSEFVLFPDGSIETRNPSVYAVPIHEQNGQSTFSALYGRAIFDFSGKVFPRQILADRLNGSIYPILPEVVIQDIRLQVFEWGIKNNISIESVSVSSVAEYFKEKSLYRAKVALIINGRNHWYYFNEDRIE